VHLHLGITVQRGGGAALAVKAHVACRLALAVQEAALVGFEVLLVAAHAQAGAVVVVVVVDGSDVVGEVGIIGDLNDDVVHYLRGIVHVPDDDGGDAGVGLQVDLHPLELAVEFQHIGVSGLFVAVGHQLRIAIDGIPVAAGDGFLQGQQGGAGRGHEGWSWLAGHGFEVFGERHVGLGADEHRVGQVQFQRDESAAGCGGGVGGSGAEEGEEGQESEGRGGFDPRYYGGGFHRRCLQTDGRWPGSIQGCGETELSRRGRLQRKRSQAKPSQALGA